MQQNSTFVLYSKKNRICKGLYGNICLVEALTYSYNGNSVNYYFMEVNDN
jgi:hypothetical protein